MSRDVIFEEHKAWEWKKDQEGIKWINTNFILEDEIELPTLFTEHPRVTEEEPQSPVHNFPVFNKRNNPTPRSSSISPVASSSEELRRMGNLEDLYDATQVMEDTTLFCFFVDSDPNSFDEAIKEEKLTMTIDEEIHAIKKQNNVVFSNDTWKLTNLQESKKTIGVKWVYDKGINCMHILSHCCSILENCVGFLTNYLEF